MHIPHCNLVRDIKSVADSQLLPVRSERKCFHPALDPPVIWQSVVSLEAILAELRDVGPLVIFREPATQNPFSHFRRSEP